MRVTRSRTARLLAAAGALSAAFAVINAPIAVAQPDLTCSNGKVTFDGTCVPPEDMNNANVALGLPQGTVNDVVPSLNQGGFVDQGGGRWHRWRPWRWWRRRWGARTLSRLGARQCITPARHCRDSPDTEVQHT